jgi:predicted secreted protein
LATPVECTRTRCVRDGATGAQLCAGEAPEDLAGRPRRPKHDEEQEACVFDDHRSKRIILVAHCLLNQNAISDGTADFPSQFTELIELIMAKRIGLIQLPCPEMTCLGLDRKDPQGGKRPLLMENTRIGELMREPGNLELLQRKAEGVASQIQEYQSYGFRVFAVVGINRSPSCGIETTSKGNREATGRGVFMELLAEACRQRRLSTPMIGVKTSETEESVARVRQLIEAADQA